jgi:uncharacterized membrane protein HdeD (DUF308 family)
MIVSGQAFSPVADPLYGKSRWIGALGALFVVSGAIALSSIATTTVMSMALVGIIMVVCGVAEMVNALQLRTWGKMVFWLLVGLLYVAAGILTFENPLLTANILTLLVGASLIMAGIAKIIVASDTKGRPSWYFIVLSGVVTLLVGLAIVTKWPVSRLYILGIFLSVDLIMATGGGWIAFGLGLKPRH